MRVRVKGDAIDEMNNEPHPMRGLTGTVIYEFPMTPAGYDCVVAYDCTHEEAARRHGMSAKEWNDMIRLNPEMNHKGRPACEELIEAHLERI